MQDRSNFKKNRMYKQEDETMENEPLRAGEKKKINFKTQGEKVLHQVLIE